MRMCGIPDSSEIIGNTHVFPAGQVNLLVRAMKRDVVRVIFMQVELSYFI